MMTKKEIRKKYAETLKLVETNESYAKVDLTNRTNCYVCHNCFHITKTRDIDKGVTPFMFPCEECKKLAYSVLYKDMLPSKEPTIEWYRPSLKECFKLRKDQGTLNHIFNGGLLSRKIKS